MKALALLMAAILLLSPIACTNLKTCHYRAVTPPTHYNYNYHASSNSPPN